MPQGSFVYGYPPIDPIIDKKEELPDYLNDLNAMHEAEKIMSVEQASDYYWKLKELHPVVDIIPACLWVYHAAAYQRAEAFLKALGLWKD